MWSESLFYPPSLILTLAKTIFGAHCNTYVAVVKALMPFSMVCTCKCMLFSAVYTKKVVTIMIDTTILLVYCVTMMKSTVMSLIVIHTHAIIGVIK